MVEKEQKTNKMGTMPMAKVLLNMGIPIIISMVLQACYNIVDSRQHFRRAHGRL